jgi:hypothetical protein
MGFNMTDALDSKLKKGPTFPELKHVIGDPNAVFELGFVRFQTICGYTSASSMGGMSDTAYEEYRDLEDLYERCSPPTEINQNRMATLRLDMQIYAMTHRDE